MGTLNLTVNHVRARFRKLHPANIRISHLLNSARLATSNAQEVYLAVGDQSNALKLGGRVCDAAPATEAKAKRAKAYETRAIGETHAEAMRRLAESLRG